MYISYDELIRTLGERTEIPEMLVMDICLVKNMESMYCVIRVKIICEVGKYNYL